MGYHSYINLLEVPVLGCPKKSFSCVMKFCVIPGTQSGALSLGKVCCPSGM